MKIKHVNLRILLLLVIIIGMPVAVYAANVAVEERQTVAVYATNIAVEERQTVAHEPTIITSSVSTSPSATASPSVVTTDSKILNSTQKEVVGYYSIYSTQSDWSNLSFGNISTLALFNIAPLANGNFQEDYDSVIPDELITIAHNNGVKVIISFGPTIGDAAVIDSILGNTSSRENSLNNILGIIQRHNFDGVDIDIEAVNPTNSVTGTSNKILMTNFVRGLRIKLNTVNPGYRIHLAIGSYYQDEDKIFDLRTLQNYVNYVMMMGYDYRAGSSTAGSNAPMDTYNNGVSIRDDINHYTILMDKNKFLLGVPWYGYEWRTQTGGLSSPILDDGTLNAYQVMKERANKSGRIWDNIWKTPWYRFQNGTQWYQGHYDDMESLGIKYDFVNSRGLGGIGIWQLEYGVSELWQLVQNKFGK